MVELKELLKDLAAGSPAAYEALVREPVLVSKILRIWNLWTLTFASQGLAGLKPHKTVGPVVVYAVGIKRHGGKWSAFASGGIGAPLLKAPEEIALASVEDGFYLTGLCYLVPKRGTDPKKFEALTQIIAQSAETGKVPPVGKFYEEYESGAELLFAAASTSGPHPVAALVGVVPLLLGLGPLVGIYSRAAAEIFNAAERGQETPEKALEVISGATEAIDEIITTALEGQVGD